LISELSNLISSETKDYTCSPFSSSTKFCSVRYRKTHCTGLSFCLFQSSCQNVYSLSL